MARHDRRAQFRVGMTVGPWKLLKRLGGTANSEVWKASRGEQALAVKFLRGRGATRYQRFTDEIRFLREMAPPRGVLPWRDSYLPELITPADPPWLAMPVAVPITDALAKLEHPAREAVAAVRDRVDPGWLGRAGDRPPRPQTRQPFFAWIATGRSGISGWSTIRTSQS